MNQIAKEIYESDLNDRNTFDFGTTDLNLMEEFNKRDADRKKRMGKIIKNGELKVGIDFHHAALIFQHGHSTRDYKKANDLASEAIRLGDKTARWLYATTMDRWLLSQNKPQKYGTQFMKENGEWRLVGSVDPNTSDDERKEYSVPKLSLALSEFKKKLNK